MTESEAAQVERKQPPPKRSAASSIGSARAWAMVALLTVLTITSFIDRFVMTLLVVDLHREFGLSDVQFGVLIGPAFIITYSIVLFPLASLVDRWNRQRLIAVGMILWSMATVASGWAHSFNQLVALRAGLAIGEAVLAPAAISLVGDLFSKERRSAPMVVVVSGSQMGIAAAAIFGAATIHLVSRFSRAVPSWLPNEPWRLVLITVGLLPPIIGILYFLVAREPARGSKERATIPSDAQPGRDRAHVRAKWPLYAFGGLHTAIVATIGVSVPIWAPTFIRRHFQVTAVQVGYNLGTTLLIASLGGVFAFQLVIRWLTANDRDLTRGMLSLGALALLISPMLMVLACTTSNPIVAVAVFGLISFLCALSYPLPTQLVQSHTPPGIRARVGAAMLLLLFILSSGLGPVLVPWTARLFASHEDLGPALMMVTFAAAFLGLVNWLGLDRWVRSRMSREPDIS